MKKILVQETVNTTSKMTSPLEQIAILAVSRDFPKLIVNLLDISRKNEIIEEEKRILLKFPHDLSTYLHTVFDSIPETTNPQDYSLFIPKRKPNFFCLSFKKGSKVDKKAKKERIFFQCQDISGETRLFEDFFLAFATNIDKNVGFLSNSYELTKIILANSLKDFESERLSQLLTWSEMLMKYVYIDDQQSSSSDDTNLDSQQKSSAYTINFIGDLDQVFIQGELGQRNMIIANRKAQSQQQQAQQQKKENFQATLQTLLYNPDQILEDKKTTNQPQPAAADQNKKEEEEEKSEESWFQELDQQNTNFMSEITDENKLTVPEFLTIFEMKFPKKQFTDGNSKKRVSGGGERTTTIKSSDSAGDPFYEPKFATYTTFQNKFAWISSGSEGKQKLEQAGISDCMKILKMTPSSAEWQDFFRFCCENLSNISQVDQFLALFDILSLWSHFGELNLEKISKNRKEKDSEKEKQLENECRALFSSIGNCFMFWFSSGAAILSIPQESVNSDPSDNEQEETDENMPEEERKMKKIERLKNRELRKLKRKRDRIHFGEGLVNSIVEQQRKLNSDPNMFFKIGKEFLEKCEKQLITLCVNEDWLYFALKIFLNMPSSRPKSREKIPVLFNTFFETIENYSGTKEKKEDEWRALIEQFFLTVENFNSILGACFVDQTIVDNNQIFGSWFMRKLLENKQFMELLNNCSIINLLGNTNGELAFICHILNIAEEEKQLFESKMKAKKTESKKKTKKSKSKTEKKEIKKKKSSFGFESDETEEEDVEENDENIPDIEDQSNNENDEIETEEEDEEESDETGNTVTLSSSLKSTLSNSSIGSGRKEHNFENLQYLVRQYVANCIYCLPLHLQTPRRAKLLLQDYLKASCLVLKVKLNQKKEEIDSNKQTLMSEEEYLFNLTKNCIEKSMLLIETR